VEVTAGAVLRAADRLVTRDAWETSRAALVALVRAQYEADPGSEGVPREEARDRLRLEPRVFDVLAAAVVDAGLLVGRERFTLPGRDPVASGADQAALTLVEEALSKHGLAPPESASLAAETGLPLAAVERALSRLSRDKRVVRVSGMWMARAAIDGLIADLRAMKTPDREAQVDVAAFKARYGLSRKFAIPLLEFLDRERVTKRVGDVRFVL
jgi:selenocysteine-specific elongation factor